MEGHQLRTGRNQRNVGLREEKERIKTQKNCVKFSKMLKTTYLPTTLKTVFLGTNYIYGTGIIVSALLLQN